MFRTRNRNFALMKSCAAGEIVQSDHLCNAFLGSGQCGEASLEAAKGPFRTVSLGMLHEG